MRSLYSTSRVAALGLLLLLVPSVALLRADDASRLPETSGKYGWFQRQRIRFHSNRLFMQAQTAIHRGEFELAESRLAAALANDPGSNRAKQMLIEVHAKAGAWAKGLALCDELLASYPAYIDGYLNKAFFATKQDNPEQAIAALEEARSRTGKQDPRYAQARKNLAHLYFTTGNYTLSTQLGEEQLQTEDTLDMRLLLAEGAIAQRDSGRALAHLDAALGLSATPEQRGEVQLKIGYLCYDQGGFEKADAALREAAQLLPGKVDRLQIMRQMAEIALQKRDFDRAAELFEAVLRERFDAHVAASHVEALAALGALDRAVDAAQAYRQHADASADFRKKLLWRLVHFHKTLNHPTAAYAAAVDLYELEPGDDALLEMASTAAQLEDKSRAVEHYTEYLSRQFRPDAAMACYYLLKNLQRLEEGEALLTRVMDCEPLDPALRTNATYELAQIRRAQGRIDDYFGIMEQLLATNGTQRFLLEYADQLLGAGRHDAALQVYRKLLDTADLDGATRHRICRNAADACLTLDRTGEAREWLEAALRHGLPDTAWNLVMARLEYRLGQFEACVQRLLVLDEKGDVVNLYLGFAFYRMNMPGLAFYHLTLVTAPEDLPADQRYNLYSNLAYLAYDQGLPARTLEFVERALALRVSDDMSLIQIKARIAIGDYAPAGELALHLIATRDATLNEGVSAVARRHPDSPLKLALLGVFAQSEARIRADLVRALRRHEDSDLKLELMMLLADKQTRHFAELLELAGLCELRLEHPDAAIDLLTSCMELDPRRFEAYFLRGLAYDKKGEFENAEADFLAYKQSADTVSRLFWGNFGLVEGRLEKYKEGTAALAVALAYYRHDIDSLAESGYQFMKWPSNTNAMDSFARAIDTYSETLPYLEGEARDEYRNNRTALKREYSKLDRRLGGQVYFSKTDYDLPEDTVVSSIDGALPSQLGAELNLRPPVIGFRDERTLDLFGRVLANFEPDSWSVDDESYQGGIGLRYKPLRTANAVASVERLFRIGDNSENNWLARVLCSREWGEKPDGSRAVRTAGKLYGDAGVFLQDPKRWYYYVDGRAGLAWNLHRQILMTLPQLMGIVRHESDDASELLSYTLAGVGFNARILEPERRYVTERWYIDACAHYVWGWFRDTPVGLDDESFEGVVFGLNFNK